MFEKFYIKIIVSIMVTNNWFVDSGSTWHVTGDLSCMHNYKEPTTPVTITVGDGQTYRVKYIGDVLLKVKALDNSEITVRLANVRYLPEMKYNLLSVFQIQESGCNVHFRANQCFIDNNNGQCIEARRSNGQWILLGNPIQPSTALAAMQQPDATRWHQRLAHLNFDDLSKMVKDEMVTGIHVSAEEFAQLKGKGCETCYSTKMTRGPFPSSTTRILHVLQLVVMDVAMSPVLSLGGAQYLATFLDAFTKYSIVVPIKRKSDVKAVTMKVLNFMERQTGRKVKHVKTDNGREYVNEELQHYFEDINGIDHQKTIPYHPEMNGMAERLNRTIFQKVRALLYDSKLPDSLWAEAAMTANFLRNYSPVKGKDKTPYELFFGVKPDLSRLRIYGCPTISYIPAEKRNKLEPVGEKGRLVGYDKDGRAYRILLSDNITVISARAREVRFFEDEGIHLFQPIITETQQDSQTQMDDYMSTDDSEDEHQEPEQPPTGSSDNMDDGQQQPRRSTRQRRQPGPLFRGQLLLAAADIPIPSTYQEAMNSPYAADWKMAMNDELNSLQTKRTWELVEVPDNVKVIPNKWVFTIKQNADGGIERFKARLVVKGFYQEHGVDVFETFAPTVSLLTLRTLLAISASYGWYIDHMDVCTAFLNGELEEDVYMQQPIGFQTGGPNVVCHLLRSLYGLKQAPRCWHQRLTHEFQQQGYTVSTADPMLYIKFINGYPVYIPTFVDDMLVIGPNQAAIDKAKNDLKNAFIIRDLGPASLFLGINIKRDMSEGIIRLSQERYIHELLSTYKMTEARPISTPISMVPRADDGEPLDTTACPYASLVGALNYLATYTRPDISFAVGALARYMANPLTGHWKAAKGVLRYLSGTSTLCLTYGGSNSKPSLGGFCDSDYASDKTTRRSTTGYVFTLHGAAISWCSKRQQTVALSTAEAEYMAAAAAIKDALWLRKLLPELGIPCDSIEIKADNQAAIHLLNNYAISQRSKHIDVIYHFARERVQSGEVSILYVPTATQVADILTKPVNRDKLIFCRSSMGIV
jgi:transposase InsO family protein